MPAPEEEVEPAAVRLRAVADGVVALTGLSGLGGRDPEGAVAAVVAMVEQAFADGRQRVEAEVRADDVDTRRLLQRAGLRPEGVSRGRGSTADGEAVDLLRLGRLADDPAPGEPGAFLGMLNATLPKKRVIAQGVVRDGRGHVLLCELTYKREWDLPGGVVDPGESPRTTLRRELQEELGADLPVGELLAVNWLPRYRQWEDALLLVFDLGVHPDLADGAVLQASEIGAVHWVAPDQVADHVAPYVARHLASIGSGEAAGMVLEDGIPPQE
ncbi:Putative ATP/GTP-binding protein [Serinicoccus hydrothermalis]|uniref:ATP/GTP-binding protein n=1 Tax=Serinicoccus hydrothermalis TaxID=1758689 RepID=A0A1B1NC36_9MICO|nr:NUDIX hydrolase [Serinicoccus hydrothermalis]ANS79020.1 Putative ATP/GTP-binding protein [Serinicoccus hydrothermalis]